ncbi:MAG TPA: XdhC family protein [Blastocatellia bacterium]|nr:XdhC family protein [Blastocatellia bacterium]
MPTWNNILDQFARLRADDEPFVMATVVAYKSPQSAKPGSKAIIKPDGSINGWIGGGCVQPIVVSEAKKALQTGRPKLVSISPEATPGNWQGVETYQMACQGGGSLEIYLEPILPRPALLIIGCSPMAQILSGLGQMLEFKVGVADPQATPEQFPEAEFLLTDLKSVKSQINARSFVVVATMGLGDEEGLEAVVGTNPQYLGLIASHEKSQSLFQYLRGKGTSDSDLDRIKCPAGIELGGETLSEIALSVMAEITRMRRLSPGKTETKSSETKGPETKNSEPRNPESRSPEPKSSKIVSLPLLPPGTEAGLESLDMVCGMTVAAATARYKLTYEEKTYYFCGLRCKELFEQFPRLYLEKRGAGGP